MKPEYTNKAESKVNPEREKDYVKIYEEPAEENIFI